MQANRDGRQAERNPRKGARRGSRGGSSLAVALPMLLFATMAVVALFGLVGVVGVFALYSQGLQPATDIVQDSGRTIERKIKEMIQSVRVTEAYPGDAGKQRIITAYLNQNYYGNGTYGVLAAAKGYFGVDSLDQLTLGQVALLAALPQSPSSYDLVRNAVKGPDGRLY